MPDKYNDESGVVFYYSPDMSGSITITEIPHENLKRFPAGPPRSITIPAAAIARFFFNAIIKREKVINLLASLRELEDRFSEYYKYADVNRKSPVDE
jgi:hypothetical protein